MSVIMLAFVFLRSFIVEPAIVDGASMEPTLFDSQIFFINKFQSLFQPLDRGDLVQAYIPSLNEVVVKRIVGLPGEKVTIQYNGVFVSDYHEESVGKLDEPYLREGTLTNSWDGKPQTFVLKENQYFLLGDNRGSSTDSRHYGSVERRHIFGLVFYLR